MVNSLWSIFKFFYATVKHVYVYVYVVFFFGNILECHGMHYPLRLFFGSDYNQGEEF